MSADGLLDGRVAVVMGGGGGMGLASVSGLLAEGASVLLGDFDVEVGQAATDELAETFGDKVIFQQVDVTHTDQIDVAIQRVVDIWGGIDVLVNVVGINISKPIEEITNEDFQKVAETDLRGTFAAIRAVVPVMKERGGGSIVSIGSVHGEVGYGDHHLYTMAKAGINGMTKELAFTYGPDRIRLNVVSPGYITPPHTPEKIAKKLKPEALEEFWREWAPLYPIGDAFTQPLRYACNPEDVANVVVFLASDKSRFVTGDVIHVDGGLIASFFRYAGRPDYVKAAKETQARWDEWYEANKLEEE